MDPSQQDRLSNLPDVLLIIIITCLPFKECVRTSVLSHRWRRLYLETRNLSFRESDYVSRSISNENARNLARRSFIRFIETWIDRVHDKVVESFEICISRPWEYADNIMAMIEFAVSKKVKKLAIDLSTPHVWIFYRDFSWTNIHVKLPESVYTLTTLESLKIYECKFDPTKFTNLGLLRSLSIGWKKLRDLESLLSKFPLLVSLELKECRVLDTIISSEQLREVVLDNVDFYYMNCGFDLPKVNIFKYTGKIFDLYFYRMNRIIKEVYLDCGLESDQYDDPSQSNKVDGNVLSRYLNGLWAARTLTVSYYLLQVIQECVNPHHLLRPMETQHLVLRTKMHTKEFNGIRILLDNCPNLETLTFEILPPSPSRTLSYAGIDPITYWMKDVTYECLRQTLKVVVVENFTGDMNELNVLRYLIRSGGVLERIELYVRAGVEKSQALVLFDKAEVLQRTSKHVDVLCARRLVTNSRFVH